MARAPWMAAAAPAVFLAVALCAAAAAGSGGAAMPELPPQYRMVSGRREQQRLTCDGNGTACDTSCDERCPDKCMLLCPRCKTYCLCDFWPGFVCGDPRFTGADGNDFYFHGRKDRDFCVVSDDDLHINAHFIGKRNPAKSRDFTWIQALGVRFADHRLYVGARRTVKWRNDVDRLELALDDEAIDVPPRPGAVWRSAAVAGLTVTRTAAANAVRVQLSGAFDVMANAVPVTEQDSRVHSYGVTEDDSLAHLDIGFKFDGLTDDVHGVLGQTYRPDYVSSNIFAADCAVSRFGRRRAGGIAMVTARAS